MHSISLENICYYYIYKYNKGAQLPKHLKKKYNELVSLNRYGVFKGFYPLYIPSKGELKTVCSKIYSKNNYDKLFLTEFKDRLCWMEISYHHYLSDDFINTFSKYIIWPVISRRILSEDFIRKYSDKVCWSIISEYQILSDAFILEFAHMVDWDYIEMFQQVGNLNINR